MYKYLCVALAIIIFFSVRTCNVERNNRLQVENKISGLNDSVKYYHDYTGTLHAIINANGISSTTRLALYRQTIDSQAKRLGVKPKHITDYIKIGAVKNGKIEMTVDELDSLIVNSRHDTLDPGVVYIPYLDSIPLALNRIWKRSWFLAPKNYFLDVYSPDSSVKITSLTNIHLDDEYSRWAISASAGATLPNLRPVVTIGISYNLLRFKRNGAK